MVSDLVADCPLCEPQKSTVWQVCICRTVLSAFEKLVIKKENRVVKIKTVTFSAKIFLQSQCRFTFWFLKRKKLCYIQKVKLFLATFVNIGKDLHRWKLLTRGRNKFR